MPEHIRINDISPRIRYVADGTQIAFTFPFPVFADADLDVFVADVQATPAADFTVAGAGSDNGGTVTFADPPAEGAAVTLVRNLTVERTTDFQESGEFRAKVINDELDKIVAMIQETEDAIGRSVRLGDTDDAANLVLPEKQARADGFLAFDADGSPIATAAMGGYPASAFMATVLDDTDADAARATLGAEAADGTIARTAANETVTGDWTFTGTVNGIDDQQARDNTILNAFEIARLDGLSTFAMVNTVVDAFEDTAGIDAAASTGESHDAVNARYGRASGATTTYTAGSGSYAVPAGVDFVEYRMWGGGGCAARPSGLYWGGGAGGGGFSKGTYAVTPGGSLAYSVAAAQSTNSADGNDSSIDGGAVVAQGGGGAISSPAGSGGAGTTENGQAGEWSSGGGTNTREGGDAGGMAYGGGAGGGNASGNPSAGYDGVAPGGGGGGGSSGSNGGTGARGEIRITPVHEMDLISNAITAAASPSELRVLIDHEDIGGVTFGTDAIAEVSRDGGSTWTAGTLAEVRDAGSGRRVLAATVDVSAQPDGGAVKMRFRTANGKEQYLHA